MFLLTLKKLHFSVARFARRKGCKVYLYKLMQPETTTCQDLGSAWNPPRPVTERRRGGMGLSNPACGLQVCRVCVDLQVKEIPLAGRMAVRCTHRCSAVHISHTWRRNPS